jgi:NAD(P)-dependent dehydrogenase (short-subunit alcohol dehydrogenase family)
VAPELTRTPAERDAALAGQRIVLIGASTGIGFATAKAALAARAKVVIAGRSVERLDRAWNALERKVEAFRLDATEEHSMAAFFARMESFDHLGVFVPTAPSAKVRAQLGAFLETPPEAFEAVIRNKFWPQLYAARHGARRIAPGGSLLFVTGQAHRKSLPGYAASAAANGATEALVRTLAVELAPVRVNAIAPGLVESDILRMAPEAFRRAAAEKVARHPVPRMGSADETAAGILLLMANRFVTGTVLELDGGMKLT